jgi:hypothetical protein
MKKTAIEWLEQAIERKHMGEFLKALIEQAKEIEMLQHKKTWIEAMYCESGDIKEFEKYYNDTYKSKLKSE